MTTRTFRVEGMTCASCVRRVEKALAAVPGVAAVAVNLATEEATVAAPGVAEAALAQALAAKGYRLVPDQAPDPHAGSVRKAALRVGLAWSLTLPLMAGMVPGLHLHLPWPAQALLAALAAFGAGSGFFRRAAAQAWSGSTSMDTLIALGAAVTGASGCTRGCRARRTRPSRPPRAWWRSCSPASGWKPRPSTAPPAAWRRKDLGSVKPSARRRSRLVGPQIGAARQLQELQTAPRVRLGKVRDVFNRVHRADLTRDGQPSIRLTVEHRWRLRSGPRPCCPNSQAQGAMESNEFRGLRLHSSKN